MTRLAWISLVCLLCACGDLDPKGQGEECFGTAECTPPLICNTMLTPPVCTPGSDMLPADAAVNQVDAPVGVVDAPPGAIDAPMNPIDAAPGMPDAMVAPDAMVTPDAMVPDAMVPDAMVSDAMPDAMM